MFSRTRTILYPSVDVLRVAEGSTRTRTITHDIEVSLAEGGLRDALLTAFENQSSPIRFIVPEEYLYLTQVEIPKEEADRSRLVRSIGDVFPEALSDLAWDFEVVAERDDRAIIEVSGVTKDFGQLLADVVTGSSIRLEAVIPESYALAHALPSDEAVLFVHERGSGTILCLAANRRVVAALILDHQPTEAECVEFIEFGKVRKQFVPEKVLFSAVVSQLTALAGLPVVLLDIPLDPIRGALGLNLSSQKDADRLDLPIRGQRKPWYRQLLHSS